MITDFEDMMGTGSGGIVTDEIELMGAADEMTDDELFMGICQEPELFGACMGGLFDRLRKRRRLRRKLKSLPKKKRRAILRKMRKARRAKRRSRRRRIALAVMPGGFIAKAIIRRRLKRRRARKKKGLPVGREWLRARRLARRARRKARRLRRRTKKVVKKRAPVAPLAPKPVASYKPTAPLSPEVRDFRRSEKQMIENDVVDQGPEEYQEPKKMGMMLPLAAGAGLLLLTTMKKK